MLSGYSYDPETLFNVARERGYDAVRQWYPGYWIFSVMPEGLQGGNVSARLAARAAAMADLVRELNQIKTDLEKRRINIAQAVTVARPRVGQAARMLWVTAEYVPNPFAMPLTLEEEFENYRVVATFLAMDLARMSAACYYAGNVSSPAVPPPAPVSPPLVETPTISIRPGDQKRETRWSDGPPVEAEQDHNEFE